MTKILAILNRSETARAVLTASQSLAERMGLDGVWVLHPRPFQDPNFMPTEEVMTDDRRAAFEDDPEATAGMIRAAVSAWQQEHAIGADHRFAEIVGEPRRTVALEGRQASMIVIGQPLSDDDAAVQAGLHAALYDAATCVVAAPIDLRTSVATRPIIAWKPSQALDRAVQAAWPLLIKAREVILMATIEQRQEEQPAAAELIARLGAEGVSCRMDEFDDGSGSLGEAILEEARVREADLLIMGAYTHNPLIEWLRTGTTQTMLQHAQIPLLMHH